MIQVSIKLQCPDCDHAGWELIGRVNNPDELIGRRWPIIECPDCLGKDRVIVAWKPKLGKK